MSGPVELPVVSPSFVAPALPVQIKKRDGVKGRVVEIIITESWGDLFYVGLNGIQIFDSNSNQLQIELKNIDAKPRDMNSIPGH